MPAAQSKRDFRFRGFPALLSALAACVLLSDVTRATLTFDQENDSICATSPELQLLGPGATIGDFHCQVNESIHALNCSNRGVPALPRTTDTAFPVGIQVLDFSDNKIRCLPNRINNTVASCDVQDCHQGCLLELHLQNNEIEYLNDEAFQNLSCLKSLDLSNNRLKSRALNKRHFFRQTNLLHLSLSGNPLGSLPDSVLVFTYMHQLQTLNLSSCQLTSLGPDSVDDFFELEVLDLSRNSLKELKAQTLRGLKNLKILDLRWNRLEVIADDTFADLTSLEDLRLSFNHITQISKVAFSTLPPPLAFLDLSSNSFTDLPLGAIKSLKNLHSVDASYNDFVELKTAHVLTTVRHLKLDFLQYLKKVDASAFSSFPELTHISLSYAHQLTTISPTAFKGSKSNLVYVRLDHNGLVTLSQELLPWERLNYLTLDSNTWYCDCKLSWIAGHLLGNNTISCDDPLKLRGQLLSSLTPDELSCPKPLVGTRFIISLTLIAFTVVAIIITVWHRRRQLPWKCLRGTSGRYITVFTKDRPVSDEVDSGNGSCADGEIDDLDLDLGTGPRPVREEAGPRSEGGGKVTIMLNTFRNGYRRLARKDGGESTQDLTLSSSV